MDSETFMPLAEHFKIIFAVVAVTVGVLVLVL